MKIYIFDEWYNFYPRPPRGGRQISCRLKIANGAISIHALREEGDGFWAAQRLSTTVFLSTPSARRATRPGGSFLRRNRFLSTPSARRATMLNRAKGRWDNISIHALREEGDLSVSVCL